MYKENNYRENNDYKLFQKPYSIEGSTPEESFKKYKNHFLWGFLDRDVDENKTPDLFQQMNYSYKKSQPATTGS